MQFPPKDIRSVTSTHRGNDCGTQPGYNRTLEARIRLIVQIVSKDALIRPDMRTIKRPGQESFTRLHSVRILATPTDMSVPGEKFFSGPMQIMTASMSSRIPVRPSEKGHLRGQWAIEVMTRCAYIGSGIRAASDGKLKFHCTLSRVSKIRTGFFGFPGMLPE